MTQWPTNDQLVEARNSVMSDVLDQIHCLDLTSDNTVTRIGRLCAIVDMLDHYCDDDIESV